jgi:hypothetical protein
MILMSGTAIAHLPTRPNTQASKNLTCLTKTIALLLRYPTVFPKESLKNIGDGLTKMQNS